LGNSITIKRINDLKKPPKETEPNQAQLNEFELNHLGFYCKVREKFNVQRKKKDFSFDIIQYKDDKEVMVQKGAKVFPIGELEAIEKRNEIIEYYLKKVKNS
jgi:hypothetical protein